MKIEYTTARKAFMLAHESLDKNEADEKPYLSYARLFPHTDKLYLQAGDGYSTFIECGLDTDGELFDTYVPIDLVRHVLALNKIEGIEVSLAESQTVFMAGQYTFGTAHLDRDEFHLEMKPTREYSFDPSELARAIAVAGVCIGNSHTKHSLQACHIYLGPRSCRFSAMDGHRASYYQRGPDEDLSERFLLPKKGVKMLNLLCRLAEKDDRITIQLSKTTARFSCGPLSFLSVSQAGLEDYPDLKRVFVGVPNVSIARASLLRCAQQCEYVCKRDDAFLRLETTADKLEVWATGLSGSVNAPYGHVNGKINTTIRYKYLVEALASMNCETIYVSTKDGRLLIASEDMSCHHCIMLILEADNIVRR